ncbi:ferric reductase-like transmembrane domain-containing protein [Candidatus Peregrinibacteria bacterium]|nr:ferric reductase-like transmembrane domain-containing protein [Candidatus Peregrinibacteria bacterium]
MRKFWKTLLWLILGINLAIIGHFWWANASFSFNTTPGVLLAFGQLTGLLAAFFVLMQLVFIGRATWIEKVFGLDKLTNIHRLNGYLSLLTILAHPIFIIASYSAAAKISFIDQFIEFWQNYEDIPATAIAVVIFVAIVFLSIYIVRKRFKYESWYYIHLLTYLAIALGFGHQLKLGSTLLSNPVFYNYWLVLYAFVFGNLIIFHFITPIYLFFKHQFRVEKLVQETADTWSVYISGKNLNSWKTEPGQFITVRFLAKNFYFQAHPFSLSAIPTNEHFRITIKVCGDFTGNIPKLKPGTKVIIGGAYGIFTANNQAKEKYLFIAGGVGITPIRSLVEDLAPQHDISLIYSNRSADNVIFKNELDQIASKHPFPIHYLYTSENTGQVNGRLDEDKLNTLIKDLKERQVYLCGPLPMNKAISALLRKMGLSAEQIHFEKFSF